MDIGKLTLIGGALALGYYLFNQSKATPAPSTTTGSSTTPTAAATPLGGLKGKKRKSKNRK